MLVTCFCTSALIWAQNPGWIMAPKYKPYIITPTPPQDLPTSPNGYTGLPAKNGQNIMVDDQNKIIFFIVDEKIYGRNGQLIDVMYATQYSSSFEVESILGEVCIAPKPGSCDSYYLFSTRYTGNSAGNPGKAAGYYGELTVQYDEFGNLLPGSGLKINTEFNCYDKLQPLYGVFGQDYSITPNIHGKGARYALSNELNNGNQLFFVEHDNRVLLADLTNQGLVYNGLYYELFSTFPSLISMDALNEKRQEMEVVELPSGKLRLALPKTKIRFSNNSNNYEGIFLMDFDQNGQLINGSQKLIKYQYIDETTFAIRGIEFSPNGEHLFVTHTSNANYAPGSLDVYDLTVANPEASKVILNGSIKYNFSQIEASSSNSILISHATGLDEISNVNGAIGGMTISSYLPIPNYPVSNPTVLSISYPELYKLYLLQDNIDGFNYSNISTSTFGANVYTTTASNAIWTPNNQGAGNPLINGNGNIAYIKDELRISAGTSLTIENMEIRFAPGARVVVENGNSSQNSGRLILKNSKLTNDGRCNSQDTWLGVEVWGVSNLNQGNLSNTKQGRFFMYNSIVENAKIGALASARNSTTTVTEVLNGDCETGNWTQITDIDVSPNSFNYSKNGGIIRSFNSSFINNESGVVMYGYMPNSLSNNLSYFSNVNFEWNSSFLFNYPRIHADLLSVKGINFKGCDFVLANPDDYPVYGEGIGIRAIQSQFYVNERCNVITQYGQPCPSPDKSTFKNLRYGIANWNTTGLTYLVDKSVFTDCLYGVFTLATEKERITRNVFEIKELVGTQSAGVVLHNSTGYTIQENTFYEFDNPTVANGSANSYGLMINNSGEAHNEVYKNTFYNLKIGGQAQKVNGTVDQTIPNSSRVGLQWICNEFKNHIYEADLGVNGIIDYQQGYFDNSSELLAKRKSARNQFSISGESTPVDHDVKVHPSSSQFQYIYIDNNLHRPDNYTEQVMTASCAQYLGLCVTDDQNACPSKLSKKIIDIKPRLLDGRNKIVKLENEIDNGDKQELLDQLSSNQNGVTYRMLMDASPYLSDEVLIGYINSNPTQGQLKQVMLANSPLSENVLDVLENANISNGTMSQINSNQSGISERTYLENKIKYEKDNIAYLENEIKSQLLLDTAELAGVDQYIAFLKEIGDIEAIKDLYAVRIDKGIMQNDSVRAVLDRNVCDEYLNLCTISEDLRMEPSIVKALKENSSYTTRLNQVIQNTSDVCVKGSAECLLSLKEDSVEMFLFLPLDMSNAMFMHNNTSEETEEMEFVSSFKVYPNPSEGTIFIDLDDKQDGEMLVRIVDLTGKVVYSSSFSDTNGERLDLSHLNTGSYLLNVTLDGDYQETHLIRMK